MNSRILILDTIDVEKMPLVEGSGLRERLRSIANMHASIDVEDLLNWCNQRTKDDRKTLELIKAEWKKSHGEFRMLKDVHYDRMLESFVAEFDLDVTQETLASLVLEIHQVKENIGKAQKMKMYLDAVS